MYISKKRGPLCIKKASFHICMYSIYDLAAIRFKALPAKNQPICCSFIE